MELVTISGTVSHCRVISHTHGHIDAKHGGSISTTHATTFRVGGKPVEMSGTISVDNGDDVTVAGLPRAQGLNAIGLRDNRSGLTFLVSVDKWNLLFGIFLLFAGVSCGSVVAEDIGGALFALIVFGGGAFFFLSRFQRDRERIRAAEAMLQSAPLLSASA